MGRHHDATVAGDPRVGGLDAVRTGRRTLLRAGAGGLVFSAAVAAAPAIAAPRGRRRVYVLVVDGCRPDEIDSGLTPTLKELRDGGLHFPRARSLPVMETIPNHVMMMTGVRPDRSGVPANSVYDAELGEVRYLDQESDVRVGTVIERLNRAGYRTGTVLSKEYLYGVFGERATHRWEPAPIVPISGHAPDVFTTEAALAMVEEFDPHLVFVNLGDIDRLGHMDLTGQSLQLARRAALISTDLQVQRFVTMLRDTGRWERSLVVVLADHSMDWSRPDRLITLTPVLEADPLLAGNTVIADNGGADLVYWTGPEAQRSAAVARIRELASAVDGVLAAHPRTKPRLRLGPEAGDVVVYCKAGWRFSDPDVFANPIPGNHGHPATERIPFFLAGGHPAVPKGVASSRRVATVDVAPTVASFLGVGAPRGGYDGRALL
ncbi:alkaline phosphatase family protein [Nocardioides ferulae]|uniref:alkaline phosphatase family protein n=1 Tax=Nocardioides ferulae TaxID=2340821 RepID=UPI000EB5B5E1|nr:nucleotide pyrophosphatase/phosphodiesterase family protein [Nocardioides ferulae]